MVKMYSWGKYGPFCVGYGLCYGEYGLCCGGYGL